MKYVQIDFCQGNKHQIAWVDSSLNLKEGKEVSFDDESDRWTVFHVYPYIEEIAHLNQKWGLNLPKKIRTER